MTKLESECQHGSVRLVGGPTEYAGRLEFCAHGRWGRVCNSLNFWGPDNAKVVCRQLGLPEEGKTFLLLKTITKLLSGDANILDGNSFERSEKQMVIGGIHCVGTEPELLECNYHSIGSHYCPQSHMIDYPDIVISCTSM